MTIDPRLGKGLNTTGGTSRHATSNATLQERFERQVRQTPHAIAVVCQGETLTYAELNRCANQLAHHLRNAGVQPGQIVGLHTERGIGAVVGILGILKAGSAYLPLDPVYPADRIAFMLEDTGVGFVVTEMALAGNLAGSAARLVDIGSLCLESQDNPEVVTDREGIAYVIYTSGSTGKPKGVLVSHHNVTRLFDATDEWYHFNRNDVWTVFHSYSFDFSVWEIWGALLYGGRLVMVPYEVSRSAGAFRELLIRERVTVLNQTPSAFRQLIQVDMAQAPAPFALRYVIFGGEALEFRTLRPWLDRYGDDRPMLVNMYGITETTVHVTYRPVRAADLDAGQGSVIGQPIPDLELHILDERMQPVPAGETGEIYVGGAGVAQGYLNRPELTAQRFLPSPFAGAKGGRLYRTGDLARPLANGDIEYLGRSDSQVKIRGYRIELGEIEATVAAFPGIRDAVVMVREDVPGDRRLVAYAVADAGADLGDGLRAHLRAALPDYMVPAHVVAIDAIPLTENGKVARNALPAPDRTPSRAVYVAPRTPREQAVAEVWRAVLGLERIGVDDDFFALGGHSLLVIDVIQRLRREGLHVEVGQLYLTPTIAAVAAAAAEAQAAAEVPANRIPAGCEHITPEMLPLVELAPADIARIVDAVPGGAGNVQDIYPLSPMQEGMLFHHRMSGEGDPYVVSTLFGAESRERIDSYIAALQLVVNRHDILRTMFLWEGLAEPLQVVCRTAPLVVEELDLDPADGEVADQMLRRFDPRRFRLDVGAAPIIGLFLARDPARGRWLMLRLHHHLLEDHTADELMSQEIIACLDGAADALPEPVPFRTFVAQSRQAAHSEETRDFFREMLADVDEPTAPFGFTDVLGKGAAVHEARLQLPLELSRAVRAAANRSRVSAAALFHLAWAQVLSRCAGRDDVVFGTVLLGRMHAGEDAGRIFGPLINSLPIRLDLEGRSVEEGLRQTHERMAQLLRHERASLVMAQGCSGVGSSAPLFSALLNFRHLKIRGQAGESMPHAMAAAVNRMGLELLRFEERTNYPIELSVDDLGDGFMLEAQVQSPVDPASICGYMHTALDAIVGALEAAPERPLAELGVLPEAERRQLVEGWNDTARDYGQPGRLHRLIEAQAARTPDAVAMSFDGSSGGEALSYAELNCRANRLARLLRRKGVGPDVLVGVYAERSLEMVATLLAILKAGGAYVPLDPSYPAERLGQMIEDAAAPLVLAQPHLAPLPAAAGEVHLLDASWQAYAAEEDGDLDDAGSPSDLAYVIFTSGSTGRPKGAMNEHGGICNRLLWMQEEYGLGAGDTVLQKTPFSFDVSVWEFFWPLITGAKLMVARPEGHRDSGYLAGLIAREGVTTLHFVPSMLRVFLEEAGLAACAGLRRVMCSGEALPRELQQRFFERLQGVELHNLYGPTEAAVDVTYWACRPDDARTTVPIGRPVANTQIYVLDGRMRPVPAGVAGEIYIGGVQVGRGYAGRAELTAARFVPDPFADRPGARLYRTGDLGRHLPDGAVEYLGRTDFQVKIRGQRIELGEIEAVLDRHPSVGQSLVMAREDQPGELRLVAYVVPRGAAPETAALRDHLARQLPAYMVPAAFVLLDALPLTPSGKADRKALPAPGAAEGNPDYVAPRTPAEAELARIWQEVLDLPRVGILDNFFELGGHSLLAMGVIERMRGVGLPVDARVIFAAPTIAGVAAALGDSSGVFAAPANAIPAGAARITPAMLPLIALTQEQIERIAARVPGGAANIQDIYPLAPLQEGFLFHHRASSEGDLYIMATQFAFDSRDRLDRYLEALQWVVGRHDVMRSLFFWEGLNEPVQVVCREARIRVQELALDPADGDIAEQLSARFNLTNYRFDMQVPPMIRAFVAYDARNGCWIYHQLTHHLMDDQATVNIQEQEIEAYLLGRAEAVPAPRPFRNYVAQARLGLSRQEHEAFFREMLADVEESTAPFGFTDVVGDGSEIREGRRFVDPALALRLSVAARRMGISTAALFHQAFALMLSRLSGRDDVVFGTVLLGRMLGGEGAERIVGPCINTLPIRIAFGTEGVGDGVRGTHTLLARTLKHEHAPLGLAQRCSAVGANVQLFNSILNYRRPSQGAGKNSLGKAALDVDRKAQISEWFSEDIPGRRFIGFLERTNYPLTLSVDDFGEGFRMVAQVQSPVDPASICGYMHTALDAIVGALEAAPERPLAELGVLPEAERRQLVEGWNDTARDYGQPGRLHRLIEAQAARTPDAVAMSFDGSSGGEALSYAELNCRANRLARLLRRKGVGPDVLVGVYAERSLEMVAALLAILKAGGAYVPLDPSYPAERLGQMIEDAAAPLVLAQPHLAPLPAAAGEVHLLDASWQAYAAEEDGDLEDAGSPSDLAYVIFTSGSTGRPKGAMNEHGGICNRLLWMQEEYGLGAGDTVLQKTPFSFDVSVWEFFWPLITGAKLVVARPEGHRDSGYLTGLIAREGVTTLHFVPSMLRVFLEEAGLAGCAGLRRVMCSGEALPRELQQRFFERLQGVELHNLYGPTEAAVDVTYWACRPDDARTTVPIGRPVANTQIYVLDGRMRPVPAGVAGEIYIGGVQVGRGYAGRAELTAARFVPDPFANRPGARLYRTGDLGRHLPDGAVEYLGRTDFQVKIRGQRIELGEIEAVLDRHPSVGQSLVMAREDQPGELRLVAYVVPRGAAPETAALRDHLARQLPAYMVPAAFVLLDALPLTPSGKADRKALPAPGAVRKAHVAPATPIEEQLAAVWREVLGLESISVEDDFFELGGHSLLALDVLVRVERAHGLRIPVRAMLEARTIRRIAASLSSAPAQALPNGIVRIEPGHDGKALFCLPGIGGLSLQYRELASLLGTGRVVYGVEMHDFDAPPADDATLPEMAAAVVREIRQVQPEGPYAVVGYSFGGHMAFEVAAELERQGQKLEFACLIDAYAPGALVRRERMMARVRRHLGTLARSTPAEAVAYLKARHQGVVDRRRERQQAAVMAVPAAVDQEETALQRQVRIATEVGSRALKAYRPSAFGGKITLVRALRVSGVLVDTTGTNGWASHARDVEVIDIRCNHFDLFDMPYVSQVAEYLGNLLARADRAPRSGPTSQSPTSEGKAVRADQSETNALIVSRISARRRRVTRDDRDEAVQRVSDPPQRHPAHHRG